MFSRKVKKIICASIIALTTLGVFGYVSLLAVEDTTPITRVLFINK